MTSIFKWLALVLVFFNVGYFVWAVISPSKDSGVANNKIVAKQGLQLKLLDELTEEERLLLVTDVIIDDSLEGNVEQVDALLASEPYCPSLGPFEKKAKLKEVGQRLADSGLRVEVRTVIVDSSEKFRVYMPPYADRNQATDALKMLRAKKIDSYIMSEGAFNNAISLGIFSSEDSAEGLVKKMLSHGYQAKVESMRIDSEVYWLDVSLHSAPEKVDQILISVMSEISGITRIDSPCKVVALTQ